jgi:micrococcal nuclease
VLVLSQQHLLALALQRPPAQAATRPVPRRPHFLMAKGLLLGWCLLPLVLAFLFALLLCERGGCNYYDENMAWGKAYLTADDIPSSYLKGVFIRGSVVSVADGDTVRLRHEPIWIFSRGKDYSKSQKGKLSETTISVRLYGVDAPETAKQGKSGQPFSEEAKSFVKQSVGDKKVWLKILGRDQYSRIIGALYYRGSLPFLQRDVSSELLKRGLAVLYTGGGAKYDGKKTDLKALEESARRRKKGVWSDPTFETPAEFKKRSKQNNSGK